MPSHGEKDCKMGWLESKSQTVGSGFVDEFPEKESRDFGNNANTSLYRLDSRSITSVKPLSISAVATSCGMIHGRRGTFSQP